MKIDYISSDGIHRAEKDAMEQMRKTFNESEFSQRWQGYGGFMMIDTTYRDREIDLVLLTHDRLIIVELKNWRGRIQPMQDHWLLNGNDMGRSPVRVMADKWKILSSKIKDRLPDPARSVWIDYRVVLCGSADSSEIPIDERTYVLTLDEFLKIAKPNGYKRIFGDLKGGKPCQHIQTFTNFFRGRDFKPSGFSFNNFQIVGEATFPHPDGLYKEYRSVKKDDRRHEALLRRWDFSVLAGHADTVDERARIALREHQVLGFIHEQNEDLDTVVLQPLSHPTRDDVDADFCELYKLPSRQSRLSDFVNRYGPELSPADRLALVKVLISHFADLHDVGVAHRDIGDHSVWLERPSKVSLSSFVAAYFPEAGTVGSLRDSIRAGKAVLPEDSEIGHGSASNPFRRDVYLLGVVAHHLLYLKPPTQEIGLYVWKGIQDDPFAGKLGAWISKSLELLPSDRFANAREMLNELNSISLGTGAKPGLDMRSFETFRTDVIPMVIYPIIENIKQGHSHLYRSEIGGVPVSVKVWYGRKPDAKRPEEMHQLQEFLEKARLLKTQHCDVLAEIIDFGISDAGTFLVQRWIEGNSLQHALRQNTATNALQLCRRLVKATMHLHGLGFVHGDLHPDNILLSGEEVHFIDAVDLFPGGGKAPYNPMYAPVDHESIPLDQRDCFAIAKMSDEILASTIDQSDVNYDCVSNEIRICLSRELKVHALDRINDAIGKILEPPPAKSVRQISVGMTRINSPSLLAADNGSYHIGVFAEKSNNKAHSPDVMVSVLGVRKQLLIALNPQSLEIVRMRIREVQHSQFVAMAHQAVAIIQAEILLVPAAADDTSTLIETLDDVPAVEENIRLVRTQMLNLDEEPDQDEIEAVSEAPKPAPATEAIWEAILDAEETTLPEIEIAGPISREISGGHRLRIPYTNEGEPLDYDADSIVEALQEINGELVRVGEMNTKETTLSILVLENPKFRMQQNVGEKIKLRSLQDLSSFRIRRLAVTRILNRESVIPNLIDYFDPLKCPAPTAIEIVPTDEELNTYNRYDEGGQLEFSLNSQQREAFENLWSSGPVSLLQGPPGTGKTSFIASFIHYALAKGARSILLASQSHEAVNNAAEKVLDLCSHTDMRLDLVRLGAEGMVSEQLRPYHSSSILQAYRDLFRSEMRERVASLSRNLGLPSAFVDNWFDLDFYLGRLYREIERLRGKLNQLPEDSAERKSLTQRIGQRIERFRTLAQEKFGSQGHEDPSEALSDLRVEFMSLHSVHSLDAVSRLDQVIAMAQEWIDRLGTLRGNFEEFLAKTRTLVCGTCVGLGRSKFGVASNRYDWVIVDEAARATPGELAVAIQAGRRILMVGDHRQLPPLYKPVVENQIATQLGFWERDVLTRSDFERAFESEYGKQVGSILRTQYRMAPPIGALVSDCFYPVPLAPGRGDPKPWFEGIPSQAKSIVTWLDTSEVGREAWERRKDRVGCENPFEAREILLLLRNILGSTNFIKALADDSMEDEKPIGVICMYADQKRLLQKLMSEQDWATGFRHLVKIDTVDSYQGKENRIIILSTTRYNAHFDQGFLKSPERVNVAISRAMDRLIIVGAARMWRERHQAAPLGRVLSYIEQHRDGKNFQIVDVAALRSASK